MATKIQYLTYYIVLTDPEAVAAYQAQYPNGVNRAIAHWDAGGNVDGGAVVEFSPSGISAPLGFLAANDPKAGPHIWTPWYSYTQPGPTDDKPFPVDVATFQRKTGGFWVFGGTTTRYYWMGQFVLQAPAVPTVDGVEVPATAITQLHACDGFEIDDYFMGNAANTLHHADASRHVGGRGLSLRANLDFVSFTITQIGLALGSVPDVWNRFYIRVRQAPTITIPVIRYHSWATDTNGAAVGVLPTGQLVIENVNLGTRSTLGTADMAPDTWHKVDVLVNWNTAASGGNGRIRVFLNGASVADISVPPASGGLGQNNQSHQRITFGNPFQIGGSHIIDLDDWIQARIPTDFNDAHWLGGTRVALVRPTGHGAGHSGWTGDFRTGLQAAQGDFTNETVYTSTTSGAVLDITTDAEASVEGEPGANGAIGAQICLSSARGATSGSLGYSLAGGGFTDEAITQSGTFSSEAPNMIMYRPSGVTPPAYPDLTPLRLRHTKGADVTSSNVKFLLAQVCLVGMFGQEDVRATEAATLPTFPDPRRIGAWSYWLARSPWGIIGKSAPISPYAIYAGTYTGNGTGQDLQFKSPICFLYIRRTSGANFEEGMWWSTMRGGHLGGRQGVRLHIVPHMVDDSAFASGSGEEAQQQRWLVRILGSDADVNALGSTYQYIAISDPGMRFICGTGFFASSSYGTVDWPLPNPDFLPQFSMIQIREDISTTITNRLGCKSEGHAAQTINNGGGSTASAMEHVTGALRVHAALHTLIASEMFAALCFRRADGNNDPGQAAVFSIGSYTGDGAASKSLVVGSSSKRPLFAIIWPDNSAAYYRDPGHTGVTSGLVSSTAVQNTAITGGIVDGISLGSTLNTNGVNFSYFILWAEDATAGNGGWGTNPADGEIVPVEPNSPADGPWPDDPPEPTEEPVTPVVLPGEPDFDQGTVISNSSTNVGGLVGGQVCEVYTRSLVNIALSRIGITKQVSNIASEASEAAAMARRHVKEDINMVLRDFPWDFATSYANLVLVTGSISSPANNDWTYAYRAPNAMMKPRRIAKLEKGRKFDQNPIPFREGIDATGPLIYCNELASATVPLVLEFTTRVTCPSFFGDAIFREALTWKFAASFANGLSRDAKKAEFCLGMYRAVLERATTVDANDQQQEPHGDADWISGRN